MEEASSEPRGTPEARNDGAGEEIAAQDEGAVDAFEAFTAAGDTETEGVEPGPPMLGKSPLPSR